MCIGSCLGSCFAGLCCGACAQCKPPKSGPSSRIPYLFLLILSGIFATFMSVYGEKHWDLKLTTVSCPGCTGNGSVFRVSLCLFFFELVHVIFIGLGAVSFHWLWFAIKFMIYVGAVTFTFFFGSNSFYSNFGQFSRYGPSPLFLLLQILILINCSYLINETLIRKGNAGQKIYWWILGIGSGLMYASTLILFILSYIYYGGNQHGEKCNAHNAIITVSLLMVVANCLLSIFIGQGTFFVSSVVSLYMGYLTVSGLQASAAVCNKLSSEEDSYVWLWLGVSLALIALVYAGLRSNLLAEFFQSPEYTQINLEEKEEKQQDKEDKQEEEHAVVPVEDDDDDKETDKDNKKSEYDDPELEISVDGTKKIGKDDKNSASKSSLTLKKENTSFHFIMCLGAAYMSMLLTNWGTAKGNIETTGKASQWVNVVCCWITCILFCWTLLAPKICPNRFGHQQTEEDDGL